MGAFLDLTGMQFGFLAALNRQPSENRKVHWLCECVCGKKLVVLAHSLTTGNTRSCGCKTKELRGEHGFAGTVEYQSWANMIRRCEVPGTIGYERYGGRGIKVCERWHKVENFVSDMGKRPVGLTLERKDNDGNYEPANCEWATAQKQARNRSTSVINDERRIQIFGLWRSGYSTRRIGAALGIKRSTVKNFLSRERVARSAPLE